MMIFFEIMRYQMESCGISSNITAFELSLLMTLYSVTPIIKSHLHIFWKCYFHHQYFINTTAIYSFFTLAFLSAENENRQLEDLPLADFGRLPERPPLSILRVSANALYYCYSGIVDSFIFIYWWSWVFFSVKGYCVYMINKIIHGWYEFSLLCAHSWAIELNTRREIPYLYVRPCIILYIIDLLWRLWLWA